MKILLLTPKPPFPASDGSSMATAQVIEGLASRGHKVTVFFLNTPKHKSTPETLPEKPQITFVSSFCDTTVRPLPAFTSLFSGRYPYTVSRFITEETVKTLKTILARTTYDIIQIESLMMTPYLDVMREIAKTPVIFRPHNTEYLIWSHLAGNEKNFLKKIYFNLLARQIKRYERSVSLRFRYILPISENDAEAFRSWNPDAAMMTLPYGITLRENRRETGSTPPTLLFLGALDWRPNQQGLAWFLKEVWPHLAQNHPGIRLLIAGRNPAPGMEKLVHMYSFHGRAVFLGEIDDPEELYAQSTVFVVPLFAGSGIRIKILEATARRLAVISTPTGAKGLPFHDRQEILLADTPETFIQAVEKLLEDEAFYTKITENALLLLKKKFDREALFNDLEQFYAGT